VRSSGKISDVSLAEDRALPPGQRHAHGWPVLHYGPVPRFRPASWSLGVVGATADGRQHSLDLADLRRLPRTRVRGDLHCVNRWTVPDNLWEGVAVRTLLDRFPPRDDVEDVMVWAEFGYSANLRMEDLASPRALLATHHDGEPLTPEHGYPLRLVVPHLYAWKGPKWLRAIEYLTEPGRGFWEDRGYHAHGDAWREERYAYQE
jgi:DMSO/TMAO reductase YedYZ molybdopterin-dependent catalytic subunit